MERLWLGNNFRSSSITEQDRNLFDSLICPWKKCFNIVLMNKNRRIVQLHRTGIITGVQNTVLSNIAKMKTKPLKKPQKAKILFSSNLESKVKTINRRIRHTMTGICHQSWLISIKIKRWCKYLRTFVWGISPFDKFR